jgi:hypothetical protein
MGTLVRVIFRKEEDALRAKEECLNAGIPVERIALSVSETADGIAAEAPGESYENQPGEAKADAAEGGFIRRIGNWIGGEASHDTRQARYGEAVRAGIRVLTVDVRSEDEKKRIANILTRCGGAIAQWSGLSRDAHPASFFVKTKI